MDCLPRHSIQLADADAVASGKALDNASVAYISLILRMKRPLIKRWQMKAVSLLNNSGSLGLRAIA